MKRLTLVCLVMTLGCKEKMKRALRIQTILALFIPVTVSYSLAQVSTEPIPVIQQTVPLNGMQMYYEIYGQGEPFVLLHGFMGSGQQWSTMIEKLAEEYQLIVPDLRGHGRSTNPSNEFTHRQAALDVFALLDHLGVDVFKGMGGSTGGMTLIHMATQQPERVEAMVLIGATIYFPEEARQMMRGFTPESQTDQDWAWMRQVHKNGDEQIKALRTQFHGFKDSYDDMNFTPPFLSTIKARTLIVHGDRDPFFPVSIPMEMYTAIPHSYLWIVPNGGHVPISDHEEIFIERALAFLGGEWEN